MGQICKREHLTRLRSSTAGIDERLAPPIDHTIESSIEWIQDDELVEVAPAALRLRQRGLDHRRRRAAEKPPGE